MSSKSNKQTAIAYKDADAKLIAQVEGVIAEAKKHTYSVSRVYAAYNAVFNLKEVTQTCASCLRSRAEKIEAWYIKGQGVKQLVPDAPTGVTVDADGNLSGEPDFAVTYLVIDGEEHFVVEEDGKTLARVAFIPEEEGAQYGTAIDGTTGLPAPFGVYKQGDKAFAVGGVKGEYTEVTGEPIADTNAHFAKLAELGITDASTNAEVLEALEVLNADETATDEEKAFIAARIAGVQEAIAAEYVAEAQKPKATPYADGVTTLTLKDATAQKVMFTTDGKEIAAIGSKGLVKNADGTNVKTGTHELADGNKLAVAVGGRATIK